MALMYGCLVMKIHFGNAMQCKAILFDSVILFFRIAKNIIYFLMSPTNRQRSPSRVKKKLPYKADVLRQVTLL